MIDVIALLSLHFVDVIGQVATYEVAQDWIYEPCKTENKHVSGTCFHEFGSWHLF